jgi:hypothetical protein
MHTVHDPAADSTSEADLRIGQGAETAEVRTGSGLGGLAHLDLDLVEGLAVVDADQEPIISGRLTTSLGECAQARRASLGVGGLLLQYVNKFSLKPCSTMSRAAVTDMQSQTNPLRGVRGG